MSAVTLYGDRVDSGRRWLYIAADVKTRNSSACRDRWHTSLHPEKKFMRWSLEEDKILYDYLAEYDNEAAENTDVHCKRKCKCTATRLVLHARDMQEIPFSPKIGRHERDFYASNMPGEKSGKLVRV